MMMRLLMSVTLFGVAGVAAAQVYKSVGPDGKVTYSDRPPLEASAKVEVLRAGVAMPAPATPILPAQKAKPAPPQLDPHDEEWGEEAPNQAATARVKQPARGTAPPPAAPPAAKPVPAKELLAPGVRSALGKKALFESSSSMCFGTGAIDKMFYARALEKWLSRNQSVISKAQTALANEFTPQERAAIEQTARTQAEAQLGWVSNQKARDLIQWCGDNANRIERGSADLQGEAGVSALMEFDPARMR
ncbi:DUF4124 domain-containing protein [Massilia arenosa]|uniref:DUF4124 domain-containing protein n=1 Tax=Zemynaea arenosa TaxID=2561931 RepID=A0A4Y9SJJ2_9BURK|nr:DUF4124 domain-containing protein [Massilia arenosa]TFW22576.1 DUF4124 domain-containing protein [Massilia arenosa]